MTESIKERVRERRRADGVGVTAPGRSKAGNPHRTPDDDLETKNPVVQEKLRIQSRRAQKESGLSVETPVAPGTTALVPAGGRSSASEQFDEESELNQGNVNETDSPLLQAELVEESEIPPPSEVVTAEIIDKGRNRKLAGLVFAVILLAVVIAVSFGVTLRSTSADNPADDSDGSRYHSEHVAYVRANSTCADTIPVSYTHLTLPTKRIV